MEELIIKIDWMFFLGIMGSLIYFAWYTNGRFATLETNHKWIERSLNDIKVGLDNGKIQAFESKSPVALTDEGTRLLKGSGIKKYIESKSEQLISECHIKKDTNPYEVQKHIFELFDNIKFDVDFDNEMKKFAFEQGVSTAILRRVGAIYFRGICLKEFNMNTKDIDAHDPKVQNNSTKS